MTNIKLSLYFHYLFSIHKGEVIFKRLFLGLIFVNQAYCATPVRTASKHLSLLRQAARGAHVVRGYAVAPLINNSEKLPVTQNNTSTRAWHLLYAAGAVGAVSGCAFLAHESAKRKELEKWADAWQRLAFFKKIEALPENEREKCALTIFEKSGPSLGMRDLSFDYEMSRREPEKSFDIYPC